MTQPDLDISEANLRTHDVWVPADTPFQRLCRLRQALWRERKGIPAGEKPNGERLGSRIEMPRAKDQLENFLTPSIRELVRNELRSGRVKGKLYGEPRIYDNLLSSQPLCFNLFGALHGDLALATRLIQRRCGARIREVTRIEFEHSPGRGDPQYTGDRSAFDVYFEYTAETGKRGFLGVEVKYHESLSDQASPHRDRYDDLANACGWWLSEALPALRVRPLQQMWRDHLLAASLIVNREYDEGAFIFLSPAGNEACSKAIAEYSRTLAAPTTFFRWTLEDVVDDLTHLVDDSWIVELKARYL